jgi:hypothetical protein
MFPSRFHRVLVLAAVIVAVWGVRLAEASITFHRLTDNGNGDVSAQFSLDVTPVGTDKVTFTFDNQGPVPSVIAAIYFGDGALLQSTGVVLTSSSGVQFTEPPTSPGNLPGATQEYKTHKFYASDADNPKPQWGVNSQIVSDWVSFTFLLQPGKTVQNVLDGISQPTNDNHVYVGLHVTGIGSKGGSDSYVNDTVIPEPATVIIWSVLGAGWAGLAVVRRRTGSRQRWSPEARTAIHSLIEKGRI